MAMDEEDRYTRITLRIPKDLHRSLSEAANQTSKSLNAEIVGRLTASFDDRLMSDSGYFISPEPDVAAKLDRVQQQLEVIAAQDATLRRQYVLQGLLTQEMLQRQKVEKQRACVAQLEGQLLDVEQRGDKSTARGLLSKLREERKWLGELEAVLRRYQTEIEEADRDLRAQRHEELLLRSSSG